MCGICGAVWTDPSGTLAAGSLKAMLDRLAEDMQRIEPDRIRFLNRTELEAYGIGERNAEGDAQTPTRRPPDLWNRHRLSAVGENSDARGPR